MIRNRPKMGQGRRGYLLENMVNTTNSIYRDKGLALIQKIPTPITPCKQDKTGRITCAYFAEKSTVDYIGVAQGIPICFDAKECHVDTFPLKNIHDHQLKFMNEFRKHDGVSFIIIYYDEKDVLYFMPVEELNMFFERMNEGGRKSIAFDELNEKHKFTADQVPVPYLDCINLYLKEESHGKTE